MRRRHFLMGAATVIPTVIPARAFGANERVTVAVIGVRGRGRGLAEGFSGLADARVKWLCDVDPGVVPGVAKTVEERQKSAPQVTNDYRRILDDAEVQGIIIATPDHWHALMTIHACQAGKDVYVEKPCSHNVLEGVRMIEAARAYGRVIQVGTQRRSAPDFQRAIEVIRGGRIGKVRLAKALNSQRRANIGKKGDGPTPPGVDYDRWLGPAPKRPFNPNRFHYNWHWFWDYGTGDLGNDGVHHVDVARWGLGDGTPTRITSAGGKLHFDDDQETPDTQTVIYDYGDRQLIYEMRLWSPYGEHGMENGNVFYGEKGFIVLGDHGYQVHEGNKLVETVRFTGRGEREHQQNFVDCIRSRKQPTCPITEGHESAMLCHLGNISHRVGRPIEFDPARHQIKGDPAASRLLSREYRRGYELPRGRSAADRG